MVAMMTPTASPMVLAFAGLERRRIGGAGAPWGATSTFLGGYLLVWMGFSVLATLAQWGLHSAAMLSAGGMKMASSSVAAVLLVSAGVFQFSSAKSACLKHCRTPVGFLISEWRERNGWSARDGRSSRAVLRRLLLAIDAAFVRCRRDERSVVRRACRSRSCGKGFARRALARAHSGYRTRSLRWRLGRRHLVAATAAVV